MMLLDTCTLLWLSSNPEKLSIKAKEAIQGNAGELQVPAISALEIAIKTKKKKLALPSEPSKWFSDVLDHYGITEIPVTSAISFLAVDLKLSHTDPANRIILATATIHQIPLITSDKLLQAYSKVLVVW